MHQVKIVFDVAPDGSFTAEVQGIKGNACSLETQRLQQLGKIVVDQPTHEMFEAANEREIAENVLGTGVNVY